jgi:hypothetical protein
MLIISDIKQKILYNAIQSFSLAVSTLKIECEQFFL